MSLKSYENESNDQDRFAPWDEFAQGYPATSPFNASAHNLLFPPLFSTDNFQPAIRIRSAVLPATGTKEPLSQALGETGASELVRGRPPDLPKAGSLSWTEIGA